jgi:hypothetical protein
MGYFGMARAEASGFRDSTILDGNVMTANFNQYSLSIFFSCSFEVRSAIEPSKIAHAKIPYPAAHTTNTSV